jgi:dihydroorotate dehydrogenase
VINRMGFNNAGAQALAARLRGLGSRPVPIGASIGKSKVTPLESAVEDYRRSLEVLYPYADYFAVNVSSPNTPGLRSLQDRDYLEALLGTLVETAGRLAGEAPVKPILVKIAPDLSDDAVVEVLEVAADNGVAGIVATNTTLARDGLHPRDAALAGQSGGLSGAPLTVRAREMVAFIHRMAGAALPVIGVGGIMSPDDGLRLLDAGASLIQVYTGMIYAGPAFAGQINRAILDRIG